MLLFILLFLAAQAQTQLIQHWTWQADPTDNYNVKAYWRHTPTANLQKVIMLSGDVVLEYVHVLSA
jgi:hypothetical protein